LAVAEDLYAARRYLESLFFGHLALEKLLKAKIVKAAKKDPLYSHDLVILARYAKIRLASDDLYFLARVNVYNIRARYQDYKKSLFKQADKKFTRSELTGIKSYFYKIR
jgi:HEPN domain-containing protein